MKDIMNLSRFSAGFNRPRRFFSSRRPLFRFPIRTLPLAALLGASPVFAGSDEAKAWSHDDATGKAGQRQTVRSTYAEVCR